MLPLPKNANWPPRYLVDQGIVKLFTIAKVPEENWPRFQSKIEGLIFIANVPKASDEIKASRKRIAKVAKKANDLRKEIDKLSNVDKIYLTEHLRIFKDDELADPEGFAEWQLPFVRSYEVAIGFLTLVTHLASGKKLKGHRFWRPLKTKKTELWGLHFFVGGLIRATKDAGGKLTYHHEYENGSLVDALEFLRKKLPRDFFKGNGLPHRTLRRIYERANKK